VDLSLCSAAADCRRRRSIRSKFRSFEVSKFDEHNDDDERRRRRTIATTTTNGERRRRTTTTNDDDVDWARLALFHKRVVSMAECIVWSYLSILCMRRTAALTTNCFIHTVAGCVVGTLLEETGLTNKLMNTCLCAPPGCLSRLRLHHCILLGLGSGKKCIPGCAFQRVGLRNCNASSGRHQYVDLGDAIKKKGRREDC